MIKSNSLKVGTFFCLFIGSSFVIAFPVVFVHFQYFREHFLVFVNICIGDVQLIDQLKIFFLFPAPSFGNKIIESNTKRVFTQLNPPIRVFSNTLTNSACAGSVMITFDKYWWMEPLSKFIDVHLRGLYRNLFIISFPLFSKISQRIIVS